MGHTSTSNKSFPIYGIQNFIPLCPPMQCHAYFLYRSVDATYWATKIVGQLQHHSSWALSWTPTEMAGGIMTPITPGGWVMRWEVWPSPPTFTQWLWDVSAVEWSLLTVTQIDLTVRDCYFNNQLNLGYVKFNIHSFVFMLIVTVVPRTPLLCPSCWGFLWLRSGTLKEWQELTSSLLSQHSNKTLLS